MRPFHETIVIAGTGNTAAEAQLLQVTDSAFLTHVVARLAVGAGFGSAVLEVNRIAAGSGVVDDDRYYESGTPPGTPIAFTASATDANVRDAFQQPIGIRTRTGQAPFVRVVPSGTAGAWTMNVSVIGWAV